MPPTSAATLFVALIALFDIVVPIRGQVMTAYAAGAYCAGLSGSDTHGFNLPASNQQVCGQLYYTNPAFFCCPSTWHCCLSQVNFLGHSCVSSMASGDTCCNTGTVCRSGTRCWDAQTAYSRSEQCCSLKVPLYQTDSSQSNMIGCCATDQTIGRGASAPPPTPTMGDGTGLNPFVVPCALLCPPNSCCRLQATLGVCELASPAAVTNVPSGALDAAAADREYSFFSGDKYGVMLWGNAGFLTLSLCAIMARLASGKNLRGALQDLFTLGNAVYAVFSASELSVYATEASCGQTCVSGTCCGSADDCSDCKCFVPEAYDDLLIAAVWITLSFVSVKYGLRGLQLLTSGTELSEDEIERDDKTFSTLANIPSALQLSAFCYAASNAATGGACNWALKSNTKVKIIVGVVLSVASVLGNLFGCTGCCGGCHGQRVTSI